MNIIVTGEEKDYNLNEHTFIEEFNEIANNITTIPANSENRTILKDKLDIIIKRHKNAGVIKEDIYIVLNGTTSIEVLFFDGNNKKIEYMEDILCNNFKFKK